MTKSDTERGKDTERKAVAALRVLGFPHAERTVRTGYRSTARELEDLGDVDGTPGIVWQIKSLRPASRAEAAVPVWLVETEQQRRAARASVGVLVVRREGLVASRWWAFVTLRTLYGLADGFSGTLTNGMPAALRAAPVRLELADACLLLRAHGFGQPLPEPALTAST
jgi:hypothetical protein